MSISKTTLLLAVAATAFLTSASRAGDLAADVAGKLRDSGALSGYRVSVKSKSGTVWLEGRVADERQLAAAVGIAETTPGVERVVNRLVIDTKPTAPDGGFALPASAWGLVGGERPSTDQAQPPAETRKSLAAMAGGLLFSNGGAPTAQGAPVQLVQATHPPAKTRGTAERTAAARRLQQPVGRPINGGQPQDPRYRTALRTGGIGEPMTLPTPGGYDGPLVDGQMVPGTMRFSEGHAAGVPGEAVAGPVAGGPGMAGGPMPMGGTGVGMPPVPMRGDGPNMPNYAWPSYAAYPNYAALQYPTQYSPTAWPYIGPFYPYPQVPLGWRRVSLEWDDGWWWLDFDERHMHSHHR